MLETLLLFLVSSSLRSHAAILKIPNELFYDNEVQVFADQRDREVYCSWEHLPKEVWPGDNNVLIAHKNSEVIAITLSGILKMSVHIDEEVQFIYVNSKFKVN